MTEDIWQNSAIWLDWLPLVMSAIGGFAAGHFYGKYRHCRDLLGATLFILYKCERRNVWFPASDRDVITKALNFINDTTWIRR